MIGVKGVTTAILLLCFVATSISQDMEFDYTDQVNWGGNCADGQMQSPIDIASSRVKYCPEYGYEKFTFLCEDFVEVIDADHNDYRLNVMGKAYIFYFNEDQNWYEAYEATSLKWHTKSEHTINGVQADAELDVFFETRNWDQIPDQARGMYSDYDLSEVVNDAQQQNAIGSSMRFLFKVDALATTDIFTDVRTDGLDGPPIWNLNTMLGCAMERYFYIYKGSTTVPTLGEECEETVWTYVSKEMFPITQDSLDAINAKIDYDDNTNFRQVQPLNGRDIFLTGAPCSHEDL